MIIVVKVLLLAVLSFSIRTYASLVDFKSIVQSFNVEEAQKLMASEGFNVNAKGMSGNTLLYDLVDEVVFNQKLTQEQLENGFQIVKEIMNNRELDTAPYNIIEIASLSKRGHKLIPALLQKYWCDASLGRAFKNVVHLEADIEVIMAFLHLDIYPFGFIMTIVQDNYKLVRKLLEHEQVSQRPAFFMMEYNLLQFAIVVGVEDMELLEGICEVMERFKILDQRTIFGLTPLMLTIEEAFKNGNSNIPLVRLFMEQYGMRIPKDRSGQRFLNDLLESPVRSEASAQIFKLLIEHKEIEVSPDNAQIMEHITDSTDCEDNQRAIKRQKRE